MTDNKEVINTLEELIETCRDGQHGYKDAAEHISDPELRTFFNQQSQERARYAGELESEVQRLGERDPNRTGSVAGVVHRKWIDLKSNLGGGDKTILDSVEQGEDSAKKTYEDALAKDLPENVLSIIRQQAQSVISAHDRVKMLRDRKAA